MCRSVPQIAVFSSLISTSLGPISGTCTSSSQMPLAASRLTSAFIICGIEELLKRECDQGIISAEEALPDGSGSSVVGKSRWPRRSDQPPATLSGFYRDQRFALVLQRAPKIGFHGPREVVALQAIGFVAFEPGQLRIVLDALDGDFDIEAVRQDDDRRDDCRRALVHQHLVGKIGRASCRERV